MNFSLLLSHTFQMSQCCLTCRSISTQEGISRNCRSLWRTIITSKTNHKMQHLLVSSEGNQAVISHFVTRESLLLSAAAFIPRDVQTMIHADSFMNIVNLGSRRRLNQAPARREQQPRKRILSVSFGVALFLVDGLKLANGSYTSMCLFPAQQARKLQHLLSAAVSVR